MKKNEIVALAVTSVLSLAAGGILGYKFAVKRLEDYYIYISDLKADDLVRQALLDFEAIQAQSPGEYYFTKEGEPTPNYHSLVDFRSTDSNDHAYKEAPNIVDGEDLNELLPEVLKSLVEDVNKDENSVRPSNTLEIELGDYTPDVDKILQGYQGKVIKPEIEKISNNHSMAGEKYQHSTPEPVIENEDNLLRDNLNWEQEEANEARDVPRRTEKKYEAPRDPNKPYEITEEDYLLGERNYATSTLTYYAGDGVVADERDELMDNVDKSVGLIHLHKMINNPNINTICVRNERLAIDFEINRVDGRYSDIAFGPQINSIPSGGDHG